MEKIRFAVLLCIRRFQTSEKVNSVLCCTALGKQRHDRESASVPRCEKTYYNGRKAIVGHSAGKGCLSGIAAGEKRTAITTDRAVERLLLFPRYFCIVIDTSFSYFSLRWSPRIEIQRIIAIKRRKNANFWHHYTTTTPTFPILYKGALQIVV